jgi:N-acetylglucosamine-6-phosphate deacetylase
MGRCFSISSISDTLLKTMRIIDLHTHGIGGLDTSNSAPLQILKIAETEGNHGITDMLLSVYSGPMEAMRWHMMIIKKALERQRMESTGQSARILGIHLEGPFLNPLRCGALDPSHFLAATEENLRKIIEGFEDVIKVMTVAPECEGGLELIRRVSDLGIIVSMGHSDATCSEAEAGHLAGARGITHLFNAMRPLHHREPGLAGFGLMHPDIYVEIIADLHHLDPRTIDLVYQVKDPEKILIVSDSVKETKKSATSSPFGSGAVTDGSGKLLGGSATVIEASRKLMDRGYDRETVLKCISENPERYLKRSP